MGIDALDGDNGMQLWLESPEAGEVQRSWEERIVQLLFSYEPSSAVFQQMAAKLAWIGARPEARSLLEREIETLEISEIQACGLWKGVCKIGRFLAEHKMEILAGAAICATGLGIAALTGYSLSVSIAGVTVAGVGSIFEEEKKPNPHIPKYAAGPIPDSFREHLQKNEAAKWADGMEFPESPNDFLITSRGVWMNGDFVSNEELSKPHPLSGFGPTPDVLVTRDGIWADGQFYPHGLLEQSHFAKELKSSSSEYNRLWKAGGEVAALPSKPMEAPPSGLLPSSPSMTQTKPKAVFPVPPAREGSYIASSEFEGSSTYVLPAKGEPRGHIMLINGVGNELGDAKKSGFYLQDLTGGEYSIVGVHNASHTVPVDLAEAALFNHAGYSPVTADLLRSEWTAFHEANADKPNAKILCVSHSQGTLHVRNALESLPREIRDRVIVVAAAPAGVVPKDLCFQSYNFASEKDIVHKFEPNPGRVSLDFKEVDGRIAADFQRCKVPKDELVILPAHPEATGIDHEFQSPTLQPALKTVLLDYQKHNGEYLPEEKGNATVDITNCHRDDRVQ